MSLDAREIAAEVDEEHEPEVPPLNPPFPFVMDAVDPMAFGLMVDLIESTIIDA